MRLLAEWPVFTLLLQVQCLLLILNIYIHLHGMTYHALYVHVHTCACTVYTPQGLYSPPGSSVHGILQARILEWATITYSR